MTTTSSTVNRPVSCLPSASLAYFRKIARGGRPDVNTTDPAFIEDIEAIRRDVRQAEGGGGMCHILSEILQIKYGWERLSVAYLSASGEIICASHVVNIMPDGAVLDCTRDQFGEGHSVSLVESSSTELGRYRPEFYEDFYPGHPDDTDGSLAPWLPFYRGQPDWIEQDVLRQERGRHWWPDDTSLIERYEAEQYCTSPSTRFP